MRLSLRLLLACAGLAGGCLLAFLLWQQRSFEEGFSGYLNVLAIERAEYAAARLIAYHRGDPGWKQLRGNPMEFGRLVDPYAPGGQRPEPPPGNAREASEFAGQVPPLRSVPPGTPSASARQGPARHTDPGFQLALFDRDDNWVAGRREPGSVVRSFALMNGADALGELRLYTGPRAPQGLDADFARQQQRSALWIGGILLAAAAGLSLWLSRRMLRPIRELAKGTHALAAGNYSLRVSVCGRDELAALAKDFNHLAQTLEQAREARRAFGADLAHELRTPLTILRGELQALQAGARPLDRAAIDSLLTEAEQLGALTEDLNQLALSDAGALAYRFETLALDELLRDEEAHWSPRLQRQGLTLRLDLADDALWIRADAVRLQQLLRNLLANAQHYTDAPGRVEVRAFREGEQIVLRIDDSPPGVSDSELPHLFDRLFRGSRTRATGGTGLGLAIVRAVADAHAATIVARPSGLGGLRIEIRFPRMPPP